MELRDYLVTFRKNWAIIVIFTIAGAALGGVYATVSEPVFTASSKVFVSTSGASNTSELAQGNSFTQQRVRTYVELVSTTAVLAPANEELESSGSVSQLRDRVSATAPTNTSIIVITARASSGEEAAKSADAVSAALVDVVLDIEGTESGDDSAVRLTVVQSAEVPQSPTSPKMGLNIALGLLLGLGLSVAFALIRTTLDTRIRNERDLEHVTDLPVLGGIVFDPKAKDRPLIVHDESMSPRAESFRTLRTNLQFLDADRKDRSFVVTSPMPNEGKSTTTANLAIALAQAGSRVLLVGADLRKPKMAEYMSVEGSVGLTNVLIGHVTLNDVLQRWGTTNLWLLPSGQIPPNPSEILGSSNMAGLIGRLNDMFDVVLYDAPPLLPVTDAAVLARLVGGTIVIVAAGRTHTNQLDSALTALENVGASASGVVLTMLPTRGPDAYGHGRYGYAYEEGK